MAISDNPCVFASEPLDRASVERIDPEWIKARLADPDSIIIPLYRGDPLMDEKGVVFLSTAARQEFSSNATCVFLGQVSGKAYFAIDASDAPTPEAAPFADIGSYRMLREAAPHLSDNALSIIGQGRWILDWHLENRHCARCGSATEIFEGGTKRVCASCEAEHFPRSNPVAIVLAQHEEACLLGRGPHFPPGFLSALAGYVEAAETPEECAVRELREEAGVEIENVRYQFSQPWPFSSSLMMGFIADARSREINLDPTEIEDARWVSRHEINEIRNGAKNENLILPPKFTIARQLIERWAAR